jgi:pimeloyl-ACP methyl ester carboxylesterase
VVNSHHVLGTGPRRVIALSGWFGSARGWGPFTDYLDREAFSYAFMDYRGYGGDRGVTGEYTIAEIAGDVLNLANELGWSTFSLLAHSMGGIVAERVAADAPERVERIAGLNAVPASGCEFDEAGWALFEGAAGNPENRRTIIDFTTGNRLSGVWLDQMVRYSLETSDRAAFAAYLPAWARTDFHAEIDGNPRLAHIPVKVIAGAHDPALDAAMMSDTWLKWHQGAELEVIADAGHYPMFETPVWLATTVERFLRGRP